MKSKITVDCKITDIDGDLLHVKMEPFSTNQAITELVTWIEKDHRIEEITIKRVG